jgi:NADH-quinone oxidoreductase subunit K
MLILVLVFGFLNIFFICLGSVALNRRNILSIMLSVELMFLSLSVNFTLFSLIFDDVIGQIFTLYIIAITASEAAVGFAILSVYYRSKKKYSCS